MADPGLTAGPQPPAGMQTPAQHLHQVSAACSGAAALLGLVSLLGWATGLRLLSSLNPAYVPMAPDTAIGCALLGVVLFRRAMVAPRSPEVPGVSETRARHPSGAPVYWNYPARAAGGLVALLGLLALVEQLTGAPITPGHLLYPVAELSGAVPIGRMSPVTGGLFIMSGAAVLLLATSAGGRAARDLSSELGAAVAVVGAVGVIGYMFGTPLLYGGSFIPMAAPTTAALLLLGVALVAAAGPDGLVLRPITGFSVRARLLRVFLPLTAGLILLEGLLREVVAEPMSVNSGLASALLVVLSVGLAGVAVAWASAGLARLLDTAEAERLRAEHDVRHSNQRLQALIDAAPLAIFTLARDDTVQAWNPAAERIFGWAAGEVIGRPPPMITPETQAEFQQLRERLLRGESLINFEGRRVRRDGTPVDLVVSTAPLHDAGGRMVGTLYLAADISQRKHAEERLLQAQKMEAVGRLTAGIAHDFNNLLTAINGFADLVQLRLAPGDPAADLVGRIQDSGRRASELVRQLMIFSRKQDVQPRVLNLNAVVSEMERMLRRIIGEDVDLAASLGPDLWWVKADSTHVEQVLANLVVNARDAMPDGGHLTIETANVMLDELATTAMVDVPPGDYVRLSVSDDGTGMTAEVQAHIFEPFFTTKEHGKGTGLGLATVYGIVQQLQGHVHVYSEPGRGTTFKIYLPRTLEAPAPDDVRPSRSIALPQGSGETILLVEDEAVVRSLARAVLTGQGYPVWEAVGRMTALQQLSRHDVPPDLLVADVVMPDCNGVDLAREVQALCPGIKVLLMSGYTEDALGRHGVTESGVAFLSKPFTVLNLARKVRKVLDS